MYALFAALFTAVLHQQRAWVAASPLPRIGSWPGCRAALADVKIGQSFPQRCPAAEMTCPSAINTLPAIPVLTSLHNSAARQLTCLLVIKEAREDAPRHLEASIEGCIFLGGD